ARPYLCSCSNGGNINQSSACYSCFWNYLEFAIFLQIMAFLALFFLALVSGCTLATQQMPRFQFSPSSKVLLSWSDTWEVGSSNMLSILTEGKHINIQVSVSGDRGESGLKRVLIYECPQSQAQRIDMDTLQSSLSPEHRCPNTIPFTVQAGNSENHFQLKMKASEVHYTQVASRRVKLVVRVEWSGGAIQSNPLFLYNFDPLGAFSVGKMGALDLKFLTPAAIKLMTRLNYSSPLDDQFPAVPFIESSISSFVKNSPEFVRSKITLGSSLYFDAGSCLHNQLGKATLFTSYYSKFDLRHQKLQKIMHLDVESGYLDFSACGLKQEITSFYHEKKPQYTIGICTIISFSGESEPYLKIQAADQRYSIDKVHYSGCPKWSTACKVAPNAKKTLTIMAGMDNTALVCPILCNDKSQTYQFFRDGNPLYASQKEEWTVIDGIRVSRTGNIIEFTPSVSSAHSGIYKCDAGSEHFFEFNVTVVSMPHFAVTYSSAASGIPSSESSGLLPEKVFAMEGESLSYNCTVMFSGLKSVTVEPTFYIPMVSNDKVNWDRLTDEAFRQKFSNGDSWMSVTTTSTSTSSKTLTMDVIRVPPANPSLGTNFSHRFECNASLNQFESVSQVGMSEYRTQTGADIFFLKRLTKNDFLINPNNNCSVQKCSVSNGAKFEFALSESTAAYLRDVGVEVSAYFMLDDLLLENVKSLFVKDASAIRFDAKTFTLTYKVLPISQEGVLNELQKRKNLTAVYNFRYQPKTALTNLRHNKSAYGSPSVALGQRDCRADKLCFYSTDFDLSNGLEFLRVDLAFLDTSLTEPGIASTSGVIVGVAIAACVALIVGLVAAYFMTRTPERAYLVEEKEIRLGHNPKAEAKNETFKDYVRAGAADNEDAPVQSVVGTKQMLNASIVSVHSKDDLELS
ncbi:hypothetical protein BOX15_Mlig003394g1, partial [Macrostomum lignano]